MRRKVSGDLYLRHRTENNYKRSRYENNMKILDKQSKEDGETLERFYNRINLDESRRKILEDTKEKNYEALQGIEQV
jgi:hypothetical protein